MEVVLPYDPAVYGVDRHDEAAVRAHVNTTVRDDGRSLEERPIAVLPPQDAEWGVRLAA